MQPEQVAQRLSTEAYREVLSVLFAQGKSDTRVMALMSRLRKELQIAPEVHKSILSQLQLAKSTGTLPALLAQGETHFPQQQMHLNTLMQQPQLMHQPQLMQQQQLMGHHNGGMHYNSSAGWPNQVPDLVPQSYPMLSQQPALHLQQARSAQLSVQPQRSRGPSKRRRSAALSGDDDSEAEVMHTYPASAHHSQPSPYGLAPQGQALQFGQFPLQGAAGWQCNGATHPAAAQPWQANNLHPGGGQMWHKQAAHTATQQMRLPEGIPELIGYKVQRYWPKDQQWFEGLITDRRAKDGLYCITYYIGDKKKETMEWFDIDKAQAVGNPQLSHYQQTPEKMDMAQYSSTLAFQNSSCLNSAKAKARK